MDLRRYMDRKVAAPLIDRINLLVELGILHRIEYADGATHIISDKTLVAYISRDRISYVDQAFLEYLEYEVLR